MKNYRKLTEQYLLKEKEDYSKYSNIEDFLIKNIGKEFAAVVKNNYEGTEWKSSVSEFIEDKNKFGQKVLLLVTTAIDTEKLPITKSLDFPADHSITSWNYLIKGLPAIKYDSGNGVDSKKRQSMLNKILNNKKPLLVLNLLKSLLKDHGIKYTKPKFTTY